MTEKKSKYYVHHSAFVDEGAVIGDGTCIWHFCHVLADANVGNNCVIGQNGMIGEGVKIGSDCKIQNNVSIWEGVELESGVFCGPSVVFTNIRTPRAFYSRRSEYERTLVRRGSTIGANATIRCGVELGEFSLVGAGAVVTQNIPPFQLWVGAPARHVGWVSHLGERLGDDFVCPRSGDRYEVHEERLSRVSRGAASIDWPNDS